MAETLRRLLTALVAAACLVAASCHPRPRAQPGPHPLVVIGVDGLEWRLVLEMAGKGRLPELASLMQEGTLARLTTLSPTYSPAIWTSMATGVVPERHGILGFARAGISDEKGQPVLFTNRERRVKALWNMTDDAGLPSCVVGYWMTFPVEKTHGVMVAQTAAPPGENPDRARKGSLRPGKSGQVHPAHLERRVFDVARTSASAAARREREIFGDTSAWPPAMLRSAERSRWSLATDSAYQSIALDLLKSGEHCDLVIVYLGLADVLGHRFWRWTFPGDFPSPPPAEEVAMFGDVLRRAYEDIDASIGELRRAAGRGATTVVVGDHGMGAFRPATVIDPMHEDGDLPRSGGHSAARDALFAAAGPGIGGRIDAPPGSALPADIAQVPRVGSVLDVTPTLLALLGLPRGRDMDGRTLDKLLDQAFVAATAPEEIPSHTPAGWSGQRRLAETAAPGVSQRIEQLRGLGYLE